jgi:hypothetical protein
MTVARAMAQDETNRRRREQMHNPQLAAKIVIACTLGLAASAETTAQIGAGIPVATATTQARAADQGTPALPGAPASPGAAPAAPAPAPAAPAPAPGVSDTPSTGLDIGTGDRVVVRVDTPGLTAVDDPTGPKYCAPAGTILQIGNTTDDGGKKFYVRVVGTKAQATSLGISNVFKPAPTKEQVAATRCGPNIHQESVTTDIQYIIDRKVLDSHEYSAAGFEYGVLLAPYKFHISDRTFTSSVTVGPYLGFHLFTTPGSTLSEVLSIGIGTVSVPMLSSPGAQPTTANKVSLSVANGVVLTMTKSGRFQLAFLVGFDWAGRGQYQYEGKPWLGIGFGANLTK